MAGFVRVSDRLYMPFRASSNPCCAARAGFSEFRRSVVGHGARKLPSPPRAVGLIREARRAILPPSEGAFFREQPLNVRDIDPTEGVFAAFHVSCVLGAAALLIISLVMLRSQVFSKVTAYRAIAANVLEFGLTVPRVAWSTRSFPWRRQPCRVQSW